jgi:hypothetical protein
LAAAAAAQAVKYPANQMYYQGQAMYGGGAMMDANGQYQNYNYNSAIDYTTYVNQQNSEGNNISKVSAFFVLFY